MKYWTSFLVAAVFNIGIFTEVSALVTTPTQPFLSASPLLVSSYGTNSDQTALSFIQLYNNSDELVVLDGWDIGYVANNNPEQVTIASLSGFMLPESHYVVAPINGLTGSGVLNYAPFTLDSGAKLKSIVLIPPVGTQPSEQPIAGAGIYRRNLTTTGYSTSTTFGKQDAGLFTTVAADPLFVLPSAPKLKIVEILPRSADCAPNDFSLVCGDYIKLQNVSGTEYDASNYRLRTDSGTSESSNAFELDYVLAPEAYVTIHLKDDGDKLSLTDGGGYVWLQDAMGIVDFYDETMVGYPSASSSSKQGWSWVLVDDRWSWTSTPQPDAANIVTVPVAEVLSTTDTECPAGKYRNPETNRCKNIEEAIATLVACDEGEYRSPETNRCRKIATLASATLTPCEPGEERNPATNRCRSIATASTTLTACAEGQERNPATNRCRNVISSSAPPTMDEPVATKNTTSYWIGGAVVVAAISYGVYEWRSEISKLFRRVIPAAK